ncbi:MAG: Fur family transcriptional regulator [Anaerolineales bacterium]|nr:Fur family transcriptional regulator [Anaerolineales bacterium]
MTHCQTCIETLRRLGLRITPQREMIIETLANGQGHMTAEEVYQQVQQRTRTVNLATVYRTLDLLVDSELATRANLLDGRTVYATFQHGPHLHLVCRRCGCTLDAGHTLMATLKEQLQIQHHFVADLQHPTIYGLCTDCAREE